VQNTGMPVSFDSAHSISKVLEVSARDFSCHALSSIIKH